MISVIADFKNRVREIELYFSLLESIDEKDALLFFPKKKSHRYKSHDKELIKVLKANMFLLLYNLCESSIRQAINEIYDKISSETLKYDEVIDEIKVIWILEKHNNFKNTAARNILNAINVMANDLIDIKFDPSSLISGNIDSRKITEFSVKYGFPVSVHKNAKNGNRLHLVKTQRNLLAHGNVSFAECGRNYTVNDLRVTKKEVILYLGCILRNIDRYLKKAKYRIK